MRLVPGARYVDTSRRHRGLVVRIVKVTTQRVMFRYERDHRNDGSRFTMTQEAFEAVFAPLDREAA
jgi:hypothetical protein